MERSSLRAYINPFLDHLQVTKGVADNTRRSYQSDLAGLFVFWEKLSLTAPNKLAKEVVLDDIIKQFRSYLLIQKTRPSTIARKISCYNSFALFLAQRQLIEPITFVRPAVALPYPKTISHREFTTLIAELEGKDLPTPLPHRDRCILELLYATGARCSELSMLRIANLNFTEKTVSIKNQKSSSRTINIDDNIVAKIKTYLQNERPAIEHSNEYLFLNYRREPLTPRSIQRVCVMFGSFLGKNRELTPQILRHSFAARLLNQGTDIATVQHLLGHSARISTERYIR